MGRYERWYFMQSGRSWQPFGKRKNGHKIFIKRVFAIFATTSSFLREIANLNQCNMQYIPYNSALLTQESLLFTPKNTVWRKSAWIATNLNISTNLACLKFLSEFKLFGEGSSWLRATSSTLILWNVFFSRNFHCAENKFHAATFHRKVFRERGGF